MATQKSYWGLSITAVNNFSAITAVGSGVPYKAVSMAGDIAHSGSGAAGLLQYGANSGEDVTLGFFGEMKFIASQTINPGDRLAVAVSGYMKVASLYDLVVGKCAEISVASGAAGRGIFNFITPAPFEVGSAGLDNFVNFTTTTDLSGAGRIYSGVDVTAGALANAGTVAAAGTVNGVLYAAVASGLAAPARYSGEVLLRAGGVVTAGRDQTCVTCGFFLDADSGDVVIGVALSASAAGNSGGTFRGLVNFAKPYVAINCFHIRY